MYAPGDVLHSMMLNNLALLINQGLGVVSVTTGAMSWSFYGLGPSSYGGLQNQTRSVDLAKLENKTHSL